MRAQEFVVEYKKYPTEDYEGIKISMVEKDGRLFVRAIDDWGVNELGSVEFVIGDGKELDPQDLQVDDRYQGQGIARTMYDYVKSQGYKIVRSWDQTDAGAGFWNKHRGEDVRVWEQEVAEDEIKLDNRAKALAWTEKVYDLYPQTWQNNHVMPMGGSGDDQQFAMFELVPSMSQRGAVEVKWFQAYPLRQGVGTRAMQELQRLAQEDGISLTLFPWDKGQVSQSKLMKFYKSAGFQPTVKGSKNMAWSPEPVAEDAITEDAVMGKIEQTGKIVRILKKQHSVPFSDEKDWLLIDTDPARGNRGLGLKWIPAHTRFEWVRPYRDTVEENFADGRHPENKGDSVRHGIPKHATMAELEKASHAKGRKGQLARWQLNMRRGRKK